MALEDLAKISKHHKGISDDLNLLGVFALFDHGQT